MKGYTDLEQSKKLTKILPIESADMYYGYKKDKPEFLPYSDIEVVGLCFPCWSLAALLGVLPNDLDASTVLSNECWDVDIMKYKKGKWLCDYVHDLDSKCHTTSADNPVDACVAMIERLHEQNLL